jgi:hypothetical protein
MFYKENLATMGTTSGKPLSLTSNDYLYLEQIVDFHRVSCHKRFVGAVWCRTKVAKCVLAF